MKIAVSSTGQDLDASVDARFGRCQHFIIVDPETMQFEVMSNPNLSAMHGAGIQTAQMIARRGVGTILTGNCGPNAFQTLSAAGIGVITGVSGTVRDGVERYKKGELQPASGASVPGHSGTGGMSSASTATPGMRASFGMGGGRGMGRGGGDGRGTGQGAGRGMMGDSFQGTSYGTPAPQRTPSPMTESSELESLKSQAEAMSKQLDQVTKHIRQLEKKKS